MPLPRWLARVNKHLFNRIELGRGNYPVLTHVGRASGTTYRTPIEVHPVDDGYLFILMYGSRSDWVRNVLAAGSAVLAIEGREVALRTPRLVSAADAVDALSADAKLPPSFLRVDEFLRMDAAGDQGRSQ